MPTLTPPGSVSDTPQPPEPIHQLEQADSAAAAATAMMAANVRRQIVRRECGMANMVFCQLNGPISRTPSGPRRA